MGELQDRVRREMKRRQMTMADVVRPEGLSQPALSKWLKFDTPPGKRLARSISLAFGWPLDWPDRAAGVDGADDDRLDLVLLAIERLAAILVQVHDSQLRLEARLGVQAARSSERSTPRDP